METYYEVLKSYTVEIKRVFWGFFYMAIRGSWSNIPKKSQTTLTGESRKGFKV